MRVGRLVSGAGAAIAVVWSARAARRRPVSDPEAKVFRWFNDAPDALERPAWVLMQAGSLGAVVVVSAITHRRRGPREALEVGAFGTAVWGGIKLIKPGVGRGRPDQHLDAVVVRGRPQSGLGYPSGHAAVSTTLALVATSPGRWRRRALIVAGLAGCSRMYVGAHLPLDVGGGFAAGALAGLSANALRSQWRRR